MDHQSCTYQSIKCFNVLLTMVRKQHLHPRWLHQQRHRLQLEQERAVVHARHGRGQPTANLQAGENHCTGAAEEGHKQGHFGVNAASNPRSEIWACRGGW